jgi:hypothetical protein
MIKSRIETSAGLTELSGTELDLVAGGAFQRPLPAPGGGGVVPPPLAPGGGGTGGGGGGVVPPPLGGRRASLGSDFSKLFTDLKDGASFSTIRADYTAILHDAGVGGF